MKYPNHLPPSCMKPLERRAELCAILARGLISLLMRDTLQLYDEIGESSLHYPPDQSAHATSTHRRTA